MTDVLLERSETGAPGRLRRLAQLSGPLAKLAVRRALRRKSPFQMTLSLNNRCNFRCVYCEIPLQARDEMPTDNWLAAIDDLRAGGMGRASIIGGEPLLRRDVGAIVHHLKRRGVHASMNTNGWLVDDRLDDIAGLDLVCVTLDGPADVHDHQRRVGSYARVLRALDALKRRRVPVVTMTVVTPAGIDQVEHVLDIARAHGIQAYFQLEHDGQMEVNQPIAPGLSQERVAQLARHLRDLKRCGAPVGNSYAALQAHETRRHLLSCDGCFAGSYYGYVFSDGTVSHCIFTHRQVARRNGPEQGYAQAFQALAAPRGDGCSCVPSFEVNRLLHLDPRVVFGALDIALRARRA
jgi:MoaA/NifB/PqqE/SkfB family radical SAM enzyme